MVLGIDRKLRQCIRTSNFARFLMFGLTLEVFNRKANQIYCCGKSVKVNTWKQICFNYLNCIIFFVIRKYWSFTVPKTLLSTELWRYILVTLSSFGSEKLYLISTPRNHTCLQHSRPKVKQKKTRRRRKSWEKPGRRRLSKINELSKLCAVVLAFSMCVCWGWIRWKLN